MIIKVRQTNIERERKKDRKKERGSMHLIDSFQSQSLSLVVEQSQCLIELL